MLCDWELGFVDVTIPRFQYQRPPAHHFYLVFLSFGGQDKGTSEDCSLDAILPRVLNYINISDYNSTTYSLEIFVNRGIEEENIS